MAFDGMVTTAITTELRNKLTDGKIDKIYQPAADEIVMQVHRGREKHLLYLSANTNHAGLYLLQEKGSNPASPPAFCMLLRKHLNQARIREIRQVDSERIVEIYTDAVNELGFRVNHRLVIEIMGKHSNILLVDIRTNRILDCIKRISGDVNRFRQTLPGLEYIAPPSHDKIPYFNLSLEAFIQATEGITQNPEKTLLRSIQGISPTMASEITYRAQSAIAGTDRPLTPAMYQELMAIVADLEAGAFLPCVYLDENHTPLDFHAIPLTMLESTSERRAYDSVSDACSAYFEGRVSSNRIRQKGSDLHHIVSSQLDRLLLKKQRLQEDLMKAENSEDLRLYGELLTAGMHQVKDGRNSAEVLNYYTGETISIPLDPRFSVSRNAQRYFKKYAKSKTAVVEKKNQLKETDQEIRYMDSVLTFIEDARTAEDLDDIRSELIENGILKRRNDRQKKRKQRFHPYEYQTTSGRKILVGRNNTENDELTFRHTASKDIWLHTKDIPGSHVVLFMEGDEPTAEEIYEAAGIAALHSKAKLSGQVPVDYVPAKYMKKPGGAKPGYVIFTHNRTVYVSPGEPDSSGHPDHTPENAES